MGIETCSNCGKGFMIGKGNRISKRYRCNKCGFTKYPGPNKRGRGVIPHVPNEEPKKSESFPMIERIELRKGNVIQEKMGTDKYRYVERERARRIREQRKEEGIQKMLRDIRKNKYSTIKTLIIEGRVWDVETGRELGDKTHNLIEVEEGDEL